MSKSGNVTLIGLNPASVTAVGLFLTGASALAVDVTPARANIAPQVYQIPAGSIADGLNMLADESGAQLIYRAAVTRNLTTRGVLGKRTLDEALRELLEGTGLTYQIEPNSNIVSIVLAQSREVLNDASPSGATQLPEIDIGAATPEQSPTRRAAGTSHSGEQSHGDYRAPDDATVSRSALPQLRTPVSTKVVSSAIIKDTQSESLGDVLRNVSGVQSVYTLGGAYEHFVVRGFEQSFSSYRNGVQVPFKRFQPANTDRVEVLKGPSAAQYGMTDPGGVINVVTKEPSAVRSHYVEQRIGSYGHYRTEAGTTGALDAEGNLTYRFDGSYLSSGGFRELTDVSAYFLAPALRWQILPSTRINFNAEIDNSRLNYDQGLPAVGTRIADLPVERNLSQGGLFDRHRNTLFDLNAEHRIGDWKIAAGVLWFTNRKDYRQYYVWANRLQPGDSFADRLTWFGPERYETKTGWAEVSGKFDTGPFEHFLRIGGQYSAMRGRAAFIEDYVDTIDIYSYRTWLSFTNPSVFDLDPPAFVVRQDDKSIGGYIQDQIKVTDALSLLLALRYEEIERRLVYSYSSPLSYNGRRDSKWSPRFGIAYKLVPWLSAFGSYSESFGPAFLYEPSTLSRPEESRQFELGLKAEMLDGALQASLALFDLAKRNIPTPSPDNPALTIAIGEARSRGLEFDAQGRIAPGLDLIGSYAFTGTRITVDNNGNVGNELPNAPRHQGSLWLKYSFDDETLRGLSLAGGVYAGSSRWGDAANSYFDDGYARLDLAAAYKFELAGASLTARLNVQNVTDEKYFFMRSRWSNMPAAPRVVMGSLRVDF